MTALNAVTDLAIVEHIAVLTLDSPPVNALSAVVRAGLYDGFTRALANPEVTAIILICSGRTFIAGADISVSAAEALSLGLIDALAREGQLRAAAQ